MRESRSCGGRILYVASSASQRSKSVLGLNHRREPIIGCAPLVLDVHQQYTYCRTRDTFYYLKMIPFTFLSDKHQLWAERDEEGPKLSTRPRGTPVLNVSLELQLMVMYSRVCGLSSIAKLTSES